jgi:hypothetical protein
MGNLLAYPDKILRKALPVLHAKLNFINTIHRDYDSQFADSGGKIGDTLRVRLPEQYVAKTGAVFVPQDINQTSIDLTVATQVHVGLNITSADLALKDEDAMERHIVPAMSTLASSIEADALLMVKDVYNQVNTAGTAISAIKVFGQARAKLNKYLAPNDGNRYVRIDSDTSADIQDALKSYFHSGKEIEKAFLEGTLGRAQGFTWAENDLLPTLTTGTRAVTDTFQLSTSAANGDTSVKITGFGNGETIKKGEVFTIKGVYAVHPETKASYSHLQQFVVTANVTLTGSADEIAMSPAIYGPTAGALQNVSVLPTASSASYVIQVAAANYGSGALSTNFQQLIAYHKNAFAFVSADLPITQSMTWASRKVMDGISMRIYKYMDGDNDTEKTRIDVLYGYKTIRPQLACRITK